LLRRWTADYECLTSNGSPAYYVAPRGLEPAQAALKARRDVAFTGARAAVGWLPAGTEATLPISQLVVYAAEPSPVAADLGLVPVAPSASNIILLKPQDPALLDAIALRDQAPLAPLPVVLADLLSLPGRYPQQGEALMDALAKADPAWRS
jgi:hypothetical protein